MVTNIYGLSASIIGTLSVIPYARDTYLKKTKPHRLAWFIFLVLSLISFFSQFALGARPSLLFYGLVVLTNLVIFTLSLRKGASHGGFTKIDVLGGLIALFSLILWAVTSSPLVALLCVLLADVIGTSLIALKALKHPHSETSITWNVGMITGTLNTIAVQQLKFSLLLAPVIFTLQTASVSLAILVGNRRHQKTKSS